MCARAPLPGPATAWSFPCGEKDWPVHMRLSWRLVIALAIASVALAYAPTLAGNHERSSRIVDQTDVAR
jgi:hypothetical protein